MRRQYVICLTIYILIQQGSGFVKQSYEGLSQDSVEKMLSDRGVSYQVVDKQTFSVAPEPTPLPDPKAGERAQAILDAKDKGKTDSERLDALIKAVGL